MTFPLFSIFYYIFSGIVLFFAAWRLQSYYKKTSSLLAKYFRNMAIAAGMTFVINTLVFIFFIDNSFLLNIGVIIGGMFVFIAHVYGVVIFFYLTFPHIPSKKIIIVGLALVVLVIMSHIKFFPLYPEIDEKGIIYFNFSSFTKTTFTLFSIAGLLPLSIAFAREAISRKHLRTRSGFLAFSFFFITVANVFQSMVTAPQLYILAFTIFPTIGYIVVFIAVILRVRAPSVDTYKEGTRHPKG